ncbi:uncharacterized protein NKAPD1 isoform X3 [Lampetra planeri]
MSRLPCIDKRLLRNVIRHTDAHNKMQEVSVMWKQRQMQTFTEDGGVRRKRRRMASPVLGRSHMRCDGYDDDDDDAVAVATTAAEASDDGRRWRRRLHEAEAPNPDRYGRTLKNPENTIQKRGTEYKLCSEMHPERGNRTLELNALWYKWYPCHPAPSCTTLHHAALTLPHPAPRCPTLHHAAPPCTTLPHPAPRCPTLPLKHSQLVAMFVLEPGLPFHKFAR